MIRTWLVTGDTHGKNTERLKRIAASVATPEEAAVIILGDSGYNFYLNRTDIKGKKDTCGMYVYCVRGNHEARPEDLNYDIIWDSNVDGNVYVDPINEKIRYFLDGGEYTIDGFTVLTIGGAYSVDKWFRLDGRPEDTEIWTGWFRHEQLTAEEMEAIERKIVDKYYDFILTHTCPYSWTPTDLFLSSVSQDTVDKTMEKWLDVVSHITDWGVWCFGHYHADRLERPRVEQYYETWDTLPSIYARWSERAQSPYYKNKSPNYYMW